MDDLVQGEHPQN